MPLKFDASCEETKDLLLKLLKVSASERSCRSIDYLMFDVAFMTLLC